MIFDDSKEGQKISNIKHHSSFLLLLLQGKYFSWKPEIDPKFPCVLNCRATADSRVMAKMDEKVIDGTRCKSDSLDMCIEGKCRVSFGVEVIILI